MKLHRLVIFPLLLACWAGSAWSQIKVVVGYTAVPDFAAAFIAKEQGVFAKRGLDVELKAITLTSNIPAALVSDSIQIGGTTPTVSFSIWFVPLKHIDNWKTYSRGYNVQ